ncbi:hypothetical protein [Hoeflea sp.]|uniref:hypothetical protein n=1 Tax=Hoeflea sp. TaxID=1940281 RepID=UPI0019A8B459|nr:hypothetical protein [Hoeflea sp.]MBC7280940.1 hypothetical protein [Hoeflea sp.]
MVFSFIWQRNAGGGGLVPGAQLNIEHFCRRPTDALNDPQRLMVTQLLAEEQASLAVLKQMFDERR